MVLGTAPTRLNLAKSHASILAAADKAEPKLRRATQAALERLQESVPNLEALIAAGNADAVVTVLVGLTIEPELFAAISDATATAAIQSMTPEATRFGIAFNDPNARAIRWAERNAANLITGKVEGLRIRAVIADATRNGIAPRVTAGLIEDLVPLLPRHQDAVTKLFWSIYEDTGDVAFARRQAARKAKKLLRYRAQMISRTESIRASNMGQQLLWEQAVDLDLLSRDVQKIWITKADDRVCVICAVLEGQTVGLTTEFLITEQATGFTDAGNVTGRKPLPSPHAEKTPPAHVQCRCAMRLERL